jgi:hypothetical protein
MKLYPIKFECVDESTCDLVFVVENNDGQTANVYIKTPVTLEYWDELTVKIREALAMMNLGD